MNIIKDYIGQKYGELTIIKEQPIHITSSGLERRQFRVQCSCGYEYDISLEGAKRGNKCINCREKRKNISKSKTTNEYIGKRYGKLVVKSVADDYISPSGRTKIRFNCLCDCGKEKIVDIYSLKSKVRSCGCNNYETFIKWCNENGREDLFDLWDYENNCEQLEVISSSGKKKYNWRCTNGHTWEASTDQVKRLKRETLCPVCSGRKINVGENDLSTEHPELIEEWDYEKNKDKRPEDYRPGSAERIWWKCRKVQHSQVNGHTF